MIWLYRIVFLPAFVVVFPFYLRRMLKRGGYGKDFSHRWGAMPKPPAKRAGVCRVWVQAVSVGEIQAIEPLLKSLHADPRFEVVLTTTTSTGYKILREKYTPLILAGGVFPIDFWLFSRRAWKKIQPDLVVLMEGELWPEHLTQAQKRKVPAVLLNGRLSDRSFVRYKKFPRLSRWVFSKLSKVLASSREDAERFAQVGVPPERVEAVGNIKFDVDYTPLNTDERAALRKSMGFGEDKSTRVLIGASTWPGEEELLLSVFAELLKMDDNWRLLLVPRHAERRAEIVKLLEAQQEPWVQRSVIAHAEQPAKICLADTTGELRALMQTADLVFIGKSLPPNEGGQTPIEAAVFGIPIVYGPHMENFRPVCASLEKAHAARRAQDAAQAKGILLSLANSPEKRAALSQASQTWHAANRGASERCLAALENFLPQAHP